MTHPLYFYTDADYPQKPRHMDYFAARTKKCSFTIWFCAGGVNYHLNELGHGYSYDSKHPLPIHHALIKHYGIKDAIKAWNESHS